jgi:hypothetical protein
MFDFCGGGDIIRVKDRFSTGSVQVWRKFNTTQPVCQFAEIGVQTLVCEFRGPKQALDSISN